MTEMMMNRIKEIKEITLTGLSAFMGKIEKDWIAIVISAVALTTSFHSCSQVNQAQKAQIRPYVIIEPSMNPLQWDGGIFVRFPYRLKNIGQAPSLRILKGYSSYLENKSGNRSLIQPFKEKTGNEDALAPTQVSAIHVDDINITGFDPAKHSSIRVELEITYEGFCEIDSRRYLSKAIFIFIPERVSNNKFIFYISQPKLSFGYEK